MLFLGMALLLRFSSSANEMAAESSQRVLAQVNWNLDSYLRNMMRVSDTVYYRVIKSADLEQSDTAQELRDALKLLYAKDRDVLVSLAVFDENGELISATPLTELKNSVTPSREGWFTAAMERIENLHFSTPHVQHLFEDPDARYHWVVSLSRHVELTRGGVIQSGVLLVDMNFSGIEQICKDVSFFDGQGYLYLIDGNGEIIYHPRQQLLYAGLQEENNLTAAGYSDGTHTEIFQSQRRQVTVKTVGYTGWKVVGVVDQPRFTFGSGSDLLFVVAIGFPQVKVSVATAMLIGVIYTMIVTRVSPADLTKRFFDGMGQGYGSILGLIIAAGVFAAGLRSCGVIDVFVEALKGSSDLAKLGAAVGPYVLGVMTGSGDAAAFAFNEAVTPHAASFGMTIPDLGYLASVAATFGRVSSPLAAGVIVISGIAGVSPIEVIKRSAPVQICTLAFLFFIS